MVDLVTLAQAKDHLRITTVLGDPSDADLDLKRAQAQAIILEYCTTTAHWREVALTWDATTVPFAVQAAILLELGELWRFRGDDRADEGPAATDGFDLAPAIRALLTRSRDPVLA
jgi:hypothetical protein